MDILSKLNERYATKIFDPSKKVSESDMEKLLEAIRLSASSFGLQYYKVLVVKDPGIREQLRNAAWGQSQITDASALLVFAVKSDMDATSIDEFIDLVSETRNVPKTALAEYSNMMKGSIAGMTQEQIDTWNSKQAYIALGFGLVSAAILDIDACPMEGFNPVEFDKILNLNKQGLNSKVIMAVGYRSEDDKYQYLTKVRQKKEDMFVRF